MPNNAADGTYTFATRATDPRNPAESARPQYTMIIAEPLVITSSATLANACADQPYSLTVQTSGGLPRLVSVSFPTRGCRSILIRARVP